MTAMTSPFRSGWIVVAAVVALVGLAPHAGQAATHTKDSLGTVRDRLKDKSAVLVDVREQGEWDKGHLKEAQLIPLSQLKKEGDVEKLTKNLPRKKIVYCHCGAGVRALTAAEILKKQGFD